MDGEDVSQSNAKKVLPLDVKRTLSKNTILPGTTVDVHVMVKNTTQHPIESLYIIEGDIHPAEEVELFPITEIDSLQFIHQGIITSGKQHKFHYTITLHPYASCEHVSIGDMQVSFSINRIPIQITIPGTTITVESISVEEFEITEGSYTCPNCGEYLELDTVLCMNCGFQINQETLEKIWTAQENYTGLIQEEIIQVDEEPSQLDEPIFYAEKKPVQRQEPIQIREKNAEAEIPVQMEEKPVKVEKVAELEIAYLKQAAQSFQEENCEDCLLNLKIALQIIERSDPNALHITDEVVSKLLTYIMEYDGKPVSKRTAATSLKFVISFIKSIRGMATRESS